MVPWALITPANRGIGFAMARQILQTTNVPVVATTRRSSDVESVKRSLLEGLNLEEGGGDSGEGRLTVLELDVTDEASIAAAASTAKSLFPHTTKSSNSNNHLRLALALPGILHPEKSPSQISAADALQTFRVNTLGPLLLMKHFSPFLPTKKTNLSPPSGSDSDSDSTVDLRGLPPTHAIWATLSARVGSTSDNSLGGWYSYRASKAGVNSITKTFDLYLKTTSGGKAMAVALHPGTVKTGLSKEFWASVKKEKLFEPEFAAERLLAVLRGLDVERGRGRCWDWKGEEILP